MLCQIENVWVRVVCVCWFLILLDNEKIGKMNTMDLMEIVFAQSKLNHHCKNVMPRLCIWKISLHCENYWCSWCACAGKTVHWDEEAREHDELSKSLVIWGMHLLQITAKRPFYSCSLCKCWKLTKHGADTWRWFA